LLPLAAATAVLEADEKGLGVVLVDLGGGTTDLVIFQGGVVRHTAIIGLGGKHLTQDIAIGLRTPNDRAEELKRSHGCAVSARISASEVLEVPGVGGRAPRVISRQVLAAIIEPRAEEILTLVLHELDRCGVTDLLAGAVLTGGSAGCQVSSSWPSASQDRAHRRSETGRRLPDGEARPSTLAHPGDPRVRRGGFARAGQERGDLGFFRQPIANGSGTICELGRCAGKQESSDARHGQQGSPAGS
jgi:cell division ATPase FtsA